MTESFDDVLKATDEASGTQRAVSTIVDQIIGTYHRRGVVYTFGNGGSSAQADHFAAELVGFYMDRSRAPIMSVNLSSQPASLTAISNDTGYENYLMRCILAMSNRDMLVLLTTSGRSPNIVRALESSLIGTPSNPAALNQPRIMMITGEAFLDTPLNAALSDTRLPRLVICSRHTPTIQEVTLRYIHRICEKVDLRMKEIA